VQKVRKAAEAKVWEEAEKRQCAEVEKKKKLEYLKKLCDKVLSKEAVLKKGKKMSHITKTKCREIIDISSNDETSLWPSKEAKEK